MNRNQYIFVDYENVHEVDLDLVAGKAVVVELVLGENHNKLSLELVERLLKYAAQVKLIKAGKSGRNALDFVLAYRVGVASVADPKGFFHIVSRDAGFDALILHLRRQHLFARRDETFAKAFEVEAPSVAPADRTKVIIERLKKNKTNRPKRKKTLVSHINSYFGNKLADSELEAIVEALTKERIIQVGEKGEVLYKL